jgi:hypothetical protein
MLGWFTPRTFRDPHLGTLERQRGRWIGATELATHGRVELRVAGDRTAPYAASIRLAADAPAQLAAVRDDLAGALLAHSEPYRDARQRDELEPLGEEFPELDAPQDVWAHVLVASIDVDARRVDSPIEVRLQAAWDQEHTLGAFLRDGQLVELNGSVIG